MSDPAISPEALRCSVHPETQAVERCARCGREACLDCAVPVRGSVLCRECAALEVGEPAVEPAPVAGRSRLDVAAAVLLAIGVLTTTFPWHRFGILTSPFSAWRFEAGPWAPLASVSMVLGAVAAARLLRPGPRNHRGRMVAASTGLAGVATLAITWEVLASPPYFSHSPAPFLALGASLGTLTLGWIRLRGRR